MKSKNFNFPNFLSSFRIASFVLMLGFIFYDKETLFIVFLILGLISDVLDGYWARKFNSKTSLGSKLDSIGDILLNISALAGIYYFKWDLIRHEAWLIYIFFSGYILFHIFAFIKYKSLPSFHTYAFKIAAIFQGIFVVLLFVWVYSKWLLWITLSISILAQIEEFILLFLLKEPIHNVKGLFFLKHRNN